jgi:hypothetical protein
MLQTDTMIPSGQRAPTGVDSSAMYSSRSGDVTQMAVSQAGMKSIFQNAYSQSLMHFIAKHSKQSGNGTAKGSVHMAG